MVFDLLGVPQLVAERLNLNLFSAQILVSIIFLMFILLPFVLLKRGKAGFTELIVGISGMGFLIVIGWLPFWFLIIVLFISCASLAKFVTKGF